MNTATMTAETGTKFWVIRPYEGRYRLVAKDSATGGFAFVRNCMGDPKSFASVSIGRDYIRRNFDGGRAFPVIVDPAKAVHTVNHEANTAIREAIRHAGI